MKKVDFLAFINKCLEDENVNFLVVGVKGVAEIEELIINPRVNIPDKKAYYDKSYNENMELNANKNIWISYVAGVERLADIENDEIADYPFGECIVCGNSYCTC